MESVGSKEVIFVYEIYLDRLFFLNFSLDLLLLLAVKWTLGRTATRTRLLLSAAAAAAGYCLLLLYTGSIRLKNLWGFGILSVGMTLGAFGYGNPGLFLDSLLTLYGYSCALGGGLLLLRKRVPGFFDRYALPGSLLIALGFVLTGRGIARRMSQRRKQRVYPVTLELSGKRWEMAGFLDTGNGLRDPVLGKPVSVLNAALSREIQEKMQPQQLMVIPYRTVGTEQGIFYAARVEKLWVYTEGKTKCVTDALVAFSDRELDHSNRFQLLLHPEILE